MFMTPCSISQATLSTFRYQFPHLRQNNSNLQNLSDHILLESVQNLLLQLQVVLLHYINLLMFLHIRPFYVKALLDEHSTISSESFLLTGTLSFDTKTSSFCKTKMTLDTGKTDSNNKPIKKCYSGELIISLTMGSCYCLLTNTDIGEICFLNFKHMFLFNQSLECRMGTISSTSSGGNRLPVVQRILISQKPLNIMGDDTSDLEFVKGQLRLNSSKILISKTELDNLQKRYENNQPISEFLENFKSLTVPEEYYLLEESNLKNISLTSDIKTKGIGILRDASVSPKYSKVSSKTNEFTFEYICGKRNV